MTCAERRGAPDGGVSARANWVGGAEGLGGDRIPSTCVLGHDAGAPAGLAPHPDPLPKERVKACTDRYIGNDLDRGHR